MPDLSYVESSLIGACMMDVGKFEKLCSVVDYKDFSIIENAVIWAAMCGVLREGMAPDLVTLSERLDHRGELQDVGGLAYLAEMVRNTPGSGNAEAYAEIVSEAGQARSLIDVLDNVKGMVQSQGWESPLKPREAIHEAYRLLNQLTAGASDRSGLIVDGLGDFVDTLDARFSGQQSAMGLSFGLADLDRITMGAHPGDYVIIAGRPSMGKTALMIHMIANSCVEGKNPGIFFSLEMSKQAITSRLICNLAKIPMSKIRNPKEEMSDDDFDRIGGPLRLLKEAPLVIDDRAGVKMSEIRLTTKRWCEYFGSLGWIGLDYLQLVRPDHRHGSREREVSEVSQTIKELAKEFNCPVIVMSQLNRALETRLNKRPIMSDLRESGSLEQDADIIAFLYRDELYDEHSQAKGTAEIIIGKQREGGVGRIMSNAILDQSRFTDMTHDEQRRIKSLNESEMIKRRPHNPLDE